VCSHPSLRQGEESASKECTKPPHVLLLQLMPPLRSLQQYYQAKCEEIDFEAQTVTCCGLWDKEIFTIPYDKLVLAQGVKTNTFNTPNVAEREGIEVFFLKNLHHARGIRNRTIEMFEIAALPDTSHKERKRLLSFIIVGGGPTSCEYASELHDFLTHDLIRLYPDLSEYVSITLIEAGPSLLGPFEANLRGYVERLFRKRNIDVRTGIAVTAVEPFRDPTYKHEASKAILSDGKEIEFGTMVWSAGLEPVKITAKLDVEKSQGRIVTDKYLRVKGQEGKVWAIGDCSTIEGGALPQLAQGHSSRQSTWPRWWREKRERRINHSASSPSGRWRRWETVRESTTGLTSAIPTVLRECFRTSRVWLRGWRGGQPTGGSRCRRPINS
jgi:NADH dehydrogenase FAD-containing subunit